VKRVGHTERPVITLAIEVYLGKERTDRGGGVIVEEGMDSLEVLDIRGHTMLCRSEYSKCG
jgi:hypothetical protein